jgi:hypothetical protein
MAIAFSTVVGGKTDDHRNPAISHEDWSSRSIASMRHAGQCTSKSDVTLIRPDAELYAIPN